MRKLMLWKRTGGFAAAVTAALVSAVQVSRGEDSFPADYVHIAETAAPGVTLLRQAEPNFYGAVGNVVIVEQSDGVVLIDAATSRGAGERVIEHVRAITDKPVKAIILTHWHNDHTIGASAILKAWPQARLISTEATREDLAAGRTGMPFAPDPSFTEIEDQAGEMAAEARANAADASLSQEERRQWKLVERKQALRAADAPGSYIATPDETFTERLVIDDPAAPVEALFLGRANTRGDLVVWLPKQKVIAVGDIVVSPTPFMINVFPAEWIEVLEQIKSYDFAVLLPGHGEAQRDTAFVDLLIAFMTDTRAKVAALAADGKTVEETLASLDLSAWRRKFVGDSRWLGFWFDAYAGSRFVESAYREARGEPLGPPPIVE